MQYSIVKYSYVLNLEDFRFDADYYKPKYLMEDAQLDKFENILLGDCAFVTDGQHGYHEVDENSPILHLTAKNAKNWFADSLGADRLAKWVDDKNRRSSLQEDDLILSTRGTVGYCALVKKDVLPANIDQDVARIAIDNNVLIPEYVLTFLNGTFGQDWLQRNTTGMVQQGLSLKKVRQCPIPVLDKAFQECIRSVVVNAYNAISESDKLFKNAQDVLLSELGLSNWQPKHQLSFVKNYSEADKAGRIDAEYFQPKYDEIIGQLIKYFDAKPIGEIDYVDITTGQYSEAYVEKEEGRPYLRGTDISNGSINTDSLVYISADLQDKSKQAKEGDVVVTRVGTIGLSARIPRECDGGTISDNLIRMRLKGEKVLNSYYVALFLGCPIGVSLMIRNSRGSVQQRLNQETLKEIPLPILPMSKQLKMAQTVINAHTAKAESKHLLECAKRAVEIAIEENEDAAIKWLQEQTKEADS